MDEQNDTVYGSSGTTSESGASAPSSRGAAHNRGPWVVDGNEGYGALDGVRVTELHGYVLAVAVDDVPDLYAEANARLIAAAPELLHALQCCVIKLSRYRQQHPETYVGGVLAEYEAVLQVSRAAISKSTGPVGDGDTASSTRGTTD